MLRTACLVLFAALLPGAAAAQSSHIEVSPVSINGADCDDDITVAITVFAFDGSSQPITSLTVQTEWEIWISDSSTCDENDPTDAQLLTDDADVDTTAATSGQYRLSVKAKTVVGSIEGLDTKSCGGDDGIDDRGFICARYQTTEFTSVAIPVDTEPLGTPTISDAEGGENKVRLKVHAASGDDITGWLAYYRVARCAGGDEQTSGLTGGSGGGGGAGGSGGSGGSGGTGGSGGNATGDEICGNNIDDDGDGNADCEDSQCAGALRDVGSDGPVIASFSKPKEFGAVSTLVVDGLKNDVEYQLVVRSKRGSDVSPPSDIVTATPRSVLDFWEAYRSAGGDQSGCGTGAATSLGTLAAFLFLARRRARP